MHQGGLAKSIVPADIQKSEARVLLPCQLPGSRAGQPVGAGDDEAVEAQVPARRGPARRGWGSLGGRLVGMLEFQALLGPHLTKQPRGHVELNLHRPTDQVFHSGRHGGRIAHGEELLDDDVGDADNKAALVAPHQLGLAEPDAVALLAEPVPDAALHRLPEIPVRYVVGVGTQKLRQSVIPEDGRPLKPFSEVRFTFSRHAVSLHRPEAVSQRALADWGT